MDRVGRNGATREDVFIEAGEDDSAFWGCVRDALARGATVWVRSPHLTVLLPHLGEYRDGLHWLRIRPRRGPGRLVDHLTKRTFDLLLAIVLGIILAPAWITAAVSILITSPGPVLFADERIGQGERSFRFYKFRTMSVADPSEEAKVRKGEFGAFARSSNGAPVPDKVLNATRVTGVGSVLRRHGLDEIPQLVNVFQGRMSVVGPRPILPYELEHYSGWRRLRFLVPGGITGMWQVFGRGRVGFEAAAAMDTYYSLSRTVLLDLRIAWRTIRIVVTGHGGR